MPTSNACFVGLPILDVAGQPVRGIPEGENAELIDETHLCPAGTCASALRCPTQACVRDDEKGDFKNPELYQPNP